MSRKQRAAPEYFMMEKPVLRELTFEALPYETHPIDIYHGPQGWGPFYGAWTPIDFADPAANISDHYGSGESNDWLFAPNYDLLTLFTDHSLDFVANTSYGVAAEQAAAEQEQGYTSTIANVIPHQSPLLTRLRSIFTNSGAIQ